MKTTLKIIQYKDGKFGAKKKGLFGWKYLTEMYDGLWSWYSGWSYCVPGGHNGYDKFTTKEKCVAKLSEYYHDYRTLKEKK